MPGFWGWERRRDNVFNILTEFLFVLQEVKKWRPEDIFLNTQTGKKFVQSSRVVVISSIIDGFFCSVYLESVSSLNDRKFLIIIVN